MAFTAVDLASDPRSMSIGPMKIQVLKWSAASGDTSGTVTADNLSRVESIIIDGLQQNVAPTFSTNVVTLAFADPLANAFGTIICFGR